MSLFTTPLVLTATDEPLEDKALVNLGHISDAEEVDEILNLNINTLFFNTMPIYEVDITEIEEISKLNPYIPKIKNINFYKPFVINEKTGNYTSIPSKINPTKIPSFERVKIVIIGNAGVGKTTLVCKKFKNFTGHSSSTIGVSHYNFNIYIKDVPLCLQIWDTAGQERYRSMIPLYARDAAAVIIVYDVTSRKSFTDVEFWFKNILRGRECDEIPAIFLVGNKADLLTERTVASGEGYLLAVKMNATFFELIASNITMSSALFAHVAEHIFEQNLTYGKTWRASQALRKIKNNDTIILHQSSNSLQCCKIL